MILFFLSFVMGATGAWLIVKFGHQIGIDDIPNHRSSHYEIIPKGAGIGILSAFVFASLVLKIPAYLWLPSFLVSLMSLWGGDHHRLSPNQRLVFQFGCSLFFLIFFLSSSRTGPLIYFLYVPLSIFIVGTANFYNFMDGIDGIAGITGLIGFSLLALYSYLLGIQEPYGKLCIALACSCIGFLCFNIPKAKVFLGDIGSILIGFLFSCLTIALSEKISDFFVMAGFLATFYFDELFTMAIRISRGDSLLHPHRKHIYQLLVNEFSISHWKIALIYGVVQLIIGISVVFVRSDLLHIFLLYGLYSLIFVIVSLIIHKKAIAK